MKLKILIIAHKNYPQLQRLISSLKHKDVYIYIHIDKKWQLSQDKISNINKIEHVKVIPTRVSAFLDTWSLVQATQHLLEYSSKDVITNSEEPEYYFLLSGQDYLIKPLDELLSMLIESYPKPFIDCTPYDRNNWIYHKFRDPFYRQIIKIRKPVIRKTFISVAYHLSPLLSRFNLSRTFKKNGIDIYGGSAWWCLPSQIVKEILIELHSKPLIKLLKKIYTPEEVVFQILAMRTSLAKMIEVNEVDRVSQNCLTYASFTTPTKPFACHPHVLTKEDYTFLTNRKIEFFARKFDSTVDEEILDLLDCHIKQK